MWEGERERGGAEEEAGEEVREGGKERGKEEGREGGRERGRKGERERAWGGRVARKGGSESVE